MKNIVIETISLLVNSALTLFSLLQYVGNFIFNKTIDKTAAVKVTVDADGTASYQLLPASASNGTTNLLTGTQAADLYQYMESLSYDVEITEDGEIREKE